MKPRLSACLALAMLALGAFAVSSRIMAQEGQSSRNPAQKEGQPSAGDDKKQTSASSEEVDQALKAYEERMGRNLDQCRKEVDQMKKELHELIDLRVQMATSLAELRGKCQTPMEGGFASEGAPNQSSMMINEFAQLHNQIRNEVDQQRSQVAQLAAQLRALRNQGGQGGLQRLNQQGAIQGANGNQPGQGGPAGAGEPGYQPNRSQQRPGQGGAAGANEPGYPRNQNKQSDKGSNAGQPLNK
jgi:hypothetical protein